MSVLPKALVEVIDSLGVIPGVGPRSAERYAYYLFRAPESKSQKVVESLGRLHSSIKLCPKTFALIDSELEVSPLYSDPGRDKQTVAVVEDSFDIAAIERTGLFKGTYHVLGGLISPIDGVDPDMLHIGELLSRIKDDKVNEIILAIPASVEGESTALYIGNQITDSSVQVTKIARGLPSGLDLEYADQITLGRAFEGRQPQA